MPSNFFRLLGCNAVAIVKEKGRMKNVLLEQSSEPLANYLRIHRRKASLTQHEVGKILGYDDDAAVSRHERFVTIPPFLMAVGYQVLFRVPASEIFAGMLQDVELGVEQRLAEFESHLRDEKARGVRAAMIARKLEWLLERRNAGPN